MVKEQEIWELFQERYGMEHNLVRSQIEVLIQKGIVFKKKGHNYLIVQSNILNRIF